jgi:GH15 family glucan-1,4-alpha-glucosidase
MSYQPIENYGVIGDMHTAALVGVDGSIDWLCFPNFDSPDVFAAILDDRKGGRFSVAPADDSVTRKQFYWPDTNVLVTRFLCGGGVGEVTDFMNAPGNGGRGGCHRHELVRRVRAMRGEMRFRLGCRPAFNFAQDAHELTVTAAGAEFHSQGLSLGLATAVALTPDGAGGVTADFRLHEGESAVFVLHEIKPGEGCGLCRSAEEAEEDFEWTVSFWRRWVWRCT